MGTVLVVIALIVGTALLGAALTRRRGHALPASGAASDLVDARAEVTILQLSTPMCARCPGTARLARSVVGTHPGSAHREVDLADRPDLASRFRVSGTPTLLLVDGTGEVRQRIVGATTRATLDAALDELLGVPA